MANTKLTPAQVSAVAGKHTACADDITGQQKTLASNIATLTTVNTGAMMRRLVEVHDDWDKITANTVTNLRTMATTLEGVARALQAQDQDNTGF